MIRDRSRSCIHLSQSTIWRSTPRTLSNSALLAKKRPFLLWIHIKFGLRVGQTMKVKMILHAFPKFRFMLSHWESFSCSRAFMYAPQFQIFLNWSRTNQSLWSSLSPSWSLIAQIWFPFFHLTADHLNAFLTWTRMTGSSGRSTQYSTRTRFKSKDAQINSTTDQPLTVLWSITRSELSNIL